jgi:hypothetical protein
MVPALVAISKPSFALLEMSPQHCHQITHLGPFWPLRNASPNQEYVFYKMAGLTGHKSFQNGSFSSKIAPEKWNVGPTISYWKCAQGSTWKLCVPQKIILNMFQYENSKQLSEYHLPLHDMHMHVKKYQKMPLTFYTHLHPKGIYRHNYSRKFSKQTADLRTNGHV